MTSLAAYDRLPAPMLVFRQFSRCRHALLTGAGEVLGSRALVHLDLGGVDLDDQVEAGGEVGGGDDGVFVGLLSRDVEEPVACRVPVVESSSVMSVILS